MGDADWDKPQIGIASSWNEITPCNLSLDRLAQGAKEGVHAGGGYPLQFGTISVSDGISMGHEGMHFSLVSREVIADSVETVMHGRAPRRLRAARRLRQVDPRHAHGRRPPRPRLASSSTPARSRPAGCKLSDGTEKDITIIDSFEAVGAVHGRHDERGRPQAHRVRVRARARAPAAACTPRTPWRRSPRRSASAFRARRHRPSADRRRDYYAHRSGEAVVNLLKPGHHGPRHPHQGGVRERDRRRHGARRLDQRRAAPARDRARGRGRAHPRTTSTASATRCRTSPT